MNRFIGKTLTSVVNKDNKELIHRRHRRHSVPPIPRPGLL